MVTPVEKLFTFIHSNHPKVAMKLRLFWREHDFNIVARKYLTDSRDGTRSGFSMEVVDALLDLMDYHDEQFGAEPIEVPFYYDGDR